MEAKINIWNYIKLKNLHSKETIHKTIRQSTEWEKIFANVILYKELVSKIYKELIQLNIKKKNPLKNGLRPLIDIFPKKTYRWPTDT